MGGSIEPGWYADPQGDAQTLRWWNGEEWTRHTRSLSELQGGAEGPEDELPTTDLSGRGGGAPSDEDELPTADLSAHRGGTTPDDDDEGTVRLGPSAPGAPGAPGDEHGTVRIDQDQFAALVAASDLPIDEITFAEPDVTASGSFEVFGMPVPVSLTVTPGADAGELLLTPVALEVAGLSLNAADIAERFGDTAAQITAPQRICIADQLPAGLTMTGLEIDGSLAVIDIDVDGAIVTDTVLQANGVCP